MKKLIGALALAAMVATSAFAEVSFGAWLCNLPTLIGYDGEDIKGAAASNPWGGWRPARLGANWTSDDGKAGMVLGICVDANGGAAGIGIFDANNFWLKPVDAVKVTIGQMDNNFGVRGDLCYGSWDWLRPNTWKFDDEGLTFSDHSELGLGLEITPMEALKIFAALPLAGEGFNGTTDLKRMDEAYGKGSIGAAYTIDGIGRIKAQFVGEYNAAGDASKYGKIEGAFDLTGIDKLFVTLGVAFRVASSDYWKANNATSPKDSEEMFKVALGASYGITEAFKLSASFAMAMFNSDYKTAAGKSVDPAMQFGVGANYALSDTLGLVADVRMFLPNNDIDSSLSFMVGLNSALGSNASMGVGFQGIVGLGDKATAGDLKVVTATEANKFAFAVPVRASIWF
ncbi:MAG: hypothetical protein II814_00765 [Treponema sp.]|nr:hypothetical protein [Treponema sp.]